MSSGHFLQPDLVLGSTFLGFTPEILERYQLQGLILDVDDTLVPLKNTELSEALKTQMARLKKKAKIWLVSNNISEMRISTIAKALDVPYISFAVKPSGRNLRKAMKAMNLPPERVAMVGDRLFTDVLAGNRLGMFTILVEPMVDPGQIARSSKMRAFEVWFSQAMGASLQEKQ